MLGWRLLVSALVIPALVGLFYADAYWGIRWPLHMDAPILLVLCILLAIRGAWEMQNLLQTRSFQPSYPLTAFLSCFVVCCSWIRVAPLQSQWGLFRNSDGWEWLALAFVVSVLVLMLRGCVRYREPGKSIETLGAELLIVSYVGLLLAATAQLRFLDFGNSLDNDRLGYLALGSLIIAAKCGDIGAYTLGRLFGKRKMAPHLSPGKTWMGALGAVLGASLGSWVWLTYAPPWFNPTWRACPVVSSILFGAIIGVAGLIGDLCESLIKRDVARKDSAALLPGFGGLLDLLDSVLYSGPVAYILWRTLPLLNYAG
jgi:phosphatidate cytidylyltransferase